MTAAAAVPPEVRRWRRRPLYFGVPALLLAVVLVIADFGTREEVSDRSTHDVEVPAVVTGQSEYYEGLATVRFDLPDGREVEAEVTSYEPVGSTVQVLVDPDNPAAVEATDVVKSSGSPAQLWIYATWVLPWFLWWASRWSTVRRTARSVAERTRTYRLWGTLSHVRARSGMGVVLYALDAENGERPICAIPLIAPPVVPGDGRVAVEVKGVPRVGGFLVPLVDGQVGWPAGRAVPARHPHMDRRDAPRPRPWVPALLTAVVLGVLVVDGAILEFRLKHQADEVQEDGAAVTATITEVIDEFTLGVEFPSPSAEGTTVATIVEAADTASYLTGESVLLRVDPDDPVAARIEGEPYDLSWLIGIIVVWAIIVGIVYAVAASRVRNRPVQHSRYLEQVGVEPVGVMPFRGRPPRDHWSSPAGCRLRLIEGQLWIRPKFRLAWWRPLARLDPEGFILVVASAVVVPWDQTILHFQETDRLGLARLKFDRLLGSSPPRRLSGVGWSQSAVRGAAALVTYLRDHPDARRGLARPDLCRRLLDELPSESLRVGKPRPLMEAGVQLDLQVVRHLAHHGVVIIDELAVRWASDVEPADVARAVAAELLAEGVDGVTGEQLEARVRWFLREPRWPFDVLTD